MLSFVRCLALSLWKETKTKAGWYELFQSVFTNNPCSLPSFLKFNSFSCSFFLVFLKKVVIFAILNHPFWVKLQSFHYSDPQADWVCGVLKRKSQVGFKNQSLFIAVMVMKVTMLLLVWMHLLQVIETPTNLYLFIWVFQFFSDWGFDDDDVVRSWGFMFLAPNCVLFLFGH